MDAFLTSVLRGLVTYSTGIFILLTLGFLFYLRKLTIGLREWRQSEFGLERSFAQRKLVSASTGLVLVILLVVGEFLLVTVMAPQMPSPSVEATPLIDPLASPTATLTGGALQTPVPGNTPNPDQGLVESECVEGVLEITSPTEGEQVSGIVDIVGSVNVESFGSYKYEYSATGTINWTTIAAGNQLKLDENLGFWYTSSLPPGVYLLRLVPLNNIGEELMPCIINVEVVPEE